MHGILATVMLRARCLDIYTATAPAHIHPPTIDNFYAIRPTLIIMPTYIKTQNNICIDRSML